jgi:hypothetical protein
MNKTKVKFVLIKEQKRPAISLFEERKGINI